MTTYIGRQTEVGIGKETTRGTALSSPSKWMRNVTADFMARNEIVTDDATQGSLSDSVGSRVTKKWFDGDLSGIVHVDSIGYFLTNIYGTPVRTTVSGAVGKSTFNLLENILHPTLSIFVKDGVEQKVHNSGVVNTYELTATPDEYVRFTSNVIAQSEAVNTSVPSYGTDYDFIGKEITVKTASTEAGLAGATAIKIKDLTITWDTGAISDFNFGSFSPDLYNAKLSIEGSFEKNYIDTTYKDLFNANTSVYMQILIEGDPVLAGSTRPSIKAIFNKVQIIEWNHSGGPDELVTETVGFKAYLNQADVKQSTVEIVNLSTY